MTHHEIRVLEDGTRVYSNGTRYKPKDLAERKYKVRKPDDPTAVRWGGEWWVPRKLLPDASRKMPETRQDRDAFEHWFRNRRCRCVVCRRKEANAWRAKARELYRQSQR